MRTFMSLLLILAGLALAPSALAESKEGEVTSAEAMAAAALTEEGLGLLGAPGKTRPFFADPACDGPEFALDRFRRATELDPRNASAWQGWGRAEEALAMCPSGYGDFLTWPQSVGLDYSDFSDLYNFALLALERPSNFFTAAISAAPKYRRAAELAPDDPGIQSDLGKNLIRLIINEKDPAVRLQLADEALAAHEKGLAGTDRPFNPWVEWEHEFMTAIIKENDPAVWRRLLAGFLRLSDLSGEKTPPSLEPGRPARPVSLKERALSRIVLNLLEAARTSPKRLSRDKAEALLEAAHIRAVRLADLALTEQPADTQPSPPPIPQAVAADSPADSSESSVLVVKKENQANPAEEKRQMRARQLRHKALIGRIQLEQAALEAGPPQWRAKIESAKSLYWEQIEDLKKLYDSGSSVRLPWTTDAFSHYRSVDQWLEAARREPRDDRRQIMARTALEFLEDAMKTQEDAEARRPAAESEAGSEGSPIVMPHDRNQAQAYVFMIKIAGVMPAGQEHNALLARAEGGFAELIDLAKQEKPSLFSSPRNQWAEALIEQSRQELDFERYKALVNRADKIIIQGLDEAAEDAPYGPARKQTRKLTRTALNFQQWLMQEKNPAHRRYLLETAVDRLAEAIRNQPDLMMSGTPGTLYGAVLGDMYFQLSELDRDKPAWHRMWFNQAVQQYQRADEQQNADRGQPWLRNDTLFRLAQIHAYAYCRQGFEPKNLETALAAWREFFDRLPDQGERNPHPRNFLPDGRPDPSAETFQTYVTTEVAMRVNEIGSVMDWDRLDSRALTAMAGLYRQLAVSAVLTPEYQSLYLSRAEKLLRRAVDKAAQAVEAAGEESRTEVVGIPSATYELGSSDRPRPRLGLGENPLRAAEADKALAMAELGLVLSEWTLLGGPCGEGGRVCLEEAEQLWQGAEELLNGSSRYAKARWAGWLNDEESVQTLIRHTRDDVNKKIFPAFAEALREPAFDEIKNESWFRKQWYGFVR